MANMYSTTFRPLPFDWELSFSQTFALGPAYLGLLHGEQTTAVTQETLPPHSGQSVGEWSLVLFGIAFPRAEKMAGEKV